MQISDRLKKFDREYQVSNNMNMWWRKAQGMVKSVEDNVRDQVRASDALGMRRCNHGSLSHTGGFVPGRSRTSRGPRGFETSSSRPG